MKISYRKKFLKQLASLPLATRTQVEIFAFEQLPNAKSITELGIIEKIQGHQGYYKSRFGSYRVGIKIENDTLTVQIVMDRKEIYRYFP